VNRYLVPIIVLLVGGATAPAEEFRVTVVSILASGTSRSIRS
jgi:hypothetical protein